MNDFIKIKEKQREIIFGYSINSVPDTMSDRLVNGENNTLFWEDVDYTCQIRGNWKTKEHLSRLERILRTAGSEMLSKDNELQEKCVKLFRFWLVNDYSNPNWWHNEIGNPLAISACAFMLEPYLGGNDIEKAVEIISRGSFKCCENARKHTGANLLWAASVSLKHALLSGDTDLLAYSVMRAENELNYGVEGIQTDGSFYQHGFRWYSGGYGRSYTNEVAPFVYMLDGTSYSFAEENIGIFLKHVLDGQQLMMHKGIFDYGAVGREFTRINGMYPAGFSGAIKMLCRCENIPRKNELQIFYSELCGKEPKKAKITYFPKIAVLNSKGKNSYLSVRGAGPRIAGAEHCNGEGVLCYNMSYGTNTCFMSTGKEYYDIAPIWDYSKMPGTTAREENDDELLNHGDWHIKTLPEAVVFGESKDNLGVYSQQFSHEEISLTASYFMYNGCMVALGTDITDAAPDKGKLFTTVEQCFDADGRIISSDTAVNGGFVYKNLDKNTEFLTEIAIKNGSWKRNSVDYPEKPASGKLFTITIPVVSAYGKYAYSVCEKDENVTVKVIRNDEKCQSVEFDGQRLAAVFHTDTVIEYCGKRYEGKSGEILFI